MEPTQRAANGVQGPIAKFSGRYPIFLDQKNHSLLNWNHVLATIGQSCKKYPFPNKYQSFSGFGVFFVKKAVCRPVFRFSAKRKKGSFSVITWPWLPKKGLFGPKKGLFEPKNVFLAQINFLWPASKSTVTIMTGYLKNNLFRTRPCPFWAQKYNFYSPYLIYNQPLRSQSDPTQRDHKHCIISYGIAW